MQTISEGVDNLLKIEEIAPPELRPGGSQDPAERQKWYDMASLARDQRAMARREFDDMTYEQDYASSQLIANSYLRRKKNEDDVRVNVGTAEKKIELILNELQSMNFQPEVRVFDEDDLEVENLGDDMADILKRTNQIERDDDVYGEAFLELLTQRAVFMEECYGPLPVVGISTGKKSVFKTKKYAQKRLLSGLQVFLGDITIPAYRFQEQPYIVKYDRMLYESGKALYGDNPNWKFVRPGTVQMDSLGLWFKYRMGNLQGQEIEVLTITTPKEQQIIINGVMMNPKDSPRPWEHDGYNITMTVVKPMSRFLAYGKAPLSSAKALAGLADETIRNLVRKMRQAIEVPLGVASGKVYSRDIWSPGAVTQGLVNGTFTPLVTHAGVTQSEFQMFDLISRKIDEFVGPLSLGTTANTGTPSATQIIEETKRSLKALGLAIVAVMRMKRDMSYLRLWTVFEEYFSAEGGYQSFSIGETSLGKGATGKKIIKLSDKDLSETELQTIFDAEQQADAQGMPFRMRSINVKKLKEFPLFWFIEVSSQERENGALDKAMFQDKMSQGATIMQLTGRQMKPDILIDSFERTWKAKGLFERNNPGVPMGNNAPAQPGGAQGAQPVEPSGGVPAQAQDLLKQITAMKGSETAGKVAPKMTGRPALATMASA